MQENVTGTCGRIVSWQQDSDSIDWVDRRSRCRAKRRRTTTTSSGMFLVFYHLISTSLFDPSVVRAFLPSPSLLLHHTPPAFPRATTRTPLSRLFAAKKKKKKKGSGDNVIAVNRIAYRNYEIIDTLEAGIALKGTEVKSIRDGKMNLRDGYVKPTKDGRSCILHNVHIGKCNQVGEYYQHEERRPRTLLVHKSQARKYLQQTEQQGMTIVPLRAYFSDSNLVKLQIALVRGKNVRDKRAAIKERDTKRETNRIIKSFRL